MSVFSMTYNKAEWMVWSPFGVGFGEEFGEVLEGFGSEYNKLLKPGRGQKATANLARTESPFHLSQTIKADHIVQQRTRFSDSMPAVAFLVSITNWDR